MFTFGNPTNVDIKIYSNLNEVLVYHYRFIKLHPYWRPNYTPSMLANCIKMNSSWLITFWMYTLMKSIKYSWNINTIIIVSDFSFWFFLRFVFFHWCVCVIFNWLPVVEKARVNWKDRNKCGGGLDYDKKVSFVMD